MNGLLSGSTVCVQTLLPEGYEEDEEFAQILSTLRDTGYSGVELNIVDIEAVDPEALQDFLAEYGLRMTAYASGAAAKAGNLSLSHENETERRKAVRACEGFLEFASHFGAGVIVGFLKGGPGAKAEPFIASLKELAPTAERLGTDLIVEATNRYESGVCNSIADTLDVIAAVGSDRIRILPDTFHMNIEEADMLRSLERCLDHCVSVHFSDNNRFLPGQGAIDFGAVLQRLDELHFPGIIALEGNVADTLRNDIRAAAAYLSHLPSNERVARNS